MNELTPATLLDILRLSITVHAGYDRLNPDLQEKTTTFLRQKKATNLARLAATEIQDVLKTSPGGQGLLGKLRLTHLTGTDPADTLSRLGWGAGQFMIYLGLHSGTLEQIAGSHLGGFRRLTVVAKIQDPLDQLRQLARIPAADPSMIWVSNLTRRFSQVIGEDVFSPEELIELAKQETRPVAELIQRARVAQTATDPQTPRGADANEQALIAREQADLVQDSLNAANPEVARQVVAEAQISAPSNAVSIAKQLGMAPDQEIAMVAEGLVQIAASAGSGKCIAQDSLIRTDRGLMRIGDFGPGLDPESQKNLQILVQGKEGPEPTSHIYHDGIRKCLRINTYRGYSITGTEPHPILVLQDGIPVWKKIKDIQIGDVACIDRRPSLFPVDLFKIPHQGKTKIGNALTEQIASLLGFIISEGYIRKKSYAISLTTSDPDQWGLYQKALSGLVKWIESQDLRPLKKGGQKQWVAEFYRKDDIRALMDFGLTRTLAHDKEIPFGIFQSPKMVVRQFLRSLFDGDGWFYKNTVGYSSASFKLASQVHLLLLSFGIVSGLRFKPNKKRGSWNLSITGEDARIFSREIGFDLEVKRNSLNRVLEKVSNPNLDTIPGIHNLCRKVLEAGKKPGYTKLLGYANFKDYGQGRRKPTQRGLQRLLERYQSETEEYRTLKSLSETPWFFDKITRIDPVEKEMVYDFVVPGTHSFSACGFINHNTRVIAGKIVYHIKEQGIPPRSIIATSFTRKSAGELRERILSYGGPNILDGAEGYVGTTHSVAGSLLREYGPKNRPGIAPEGLQSMGIQIAMKQVAMRSEQFIPGPSEGVTLLTDLTRIPGGGAGGGSRSVYWAKPAQQWFNLGREVTTPDGSPMGARSVATMISNWKGNMISPSQAWEDTEGAGVAAAYAAYEWLKRNDLSWQGLMDFDDMLVEAVRLLVTDPDRLRTIQRRFRVICVDEAQDQNHTQNILFGLIAGTYDPKTLEPYQDDRHTARVYAKIGDGDQSIYKFRGAQPGLFTADSDLVGKGGKFKTYQISTNYRSGANIVNAAHRLIQLNEDRIPMTCRADPARRGDGQIQYTRVGTHGEGARLVAKQIEESVKITEGGTYSDYGIATRTNAEAYGYVLELMKLAIPFRSKLNPLRDKRTRALLNWIQLANPVTGGAAQNKALMEAHGTPGFFLDERFGERVASLSRETRESSYLKVLQHNWDQIYQGNQAWRNEKSVRAYLDAIQQMREQNLSPSGLVDWVLNLRGVGDKKTLLEEMEEEIRTDEELMGELRGELGGKDPSEEDIRAQALAPIQPIMGLLGAHPDVGGALDYIEKLQRTASKADKSEESRDPAVQVDTVHGWKGLETKHIYVPMAKGVFPSGQSDDIEEERRLAYVALTRGRDSVTVIAPDRNHRGKDAGPSVFISEACIEQVHLSGWGSDATPEDGAGVSDAE